MESEMHEEFVTKREVRISERKKFFSWFFSEYKASTGNCRIARAKNERREETKHEFFEFIYFFGIIVIFQKTDFFATVKSMYNFIPKTWNMSHCKSHFRYV